MIKSSIISNRNIEHQRTKIVGCCQFIWNKDLALVKQDDEYYRKILEISKMNGGDGKGISPLFKFNPYNQLSALLTTWKQQSDTVFLKVYSKSLQIVLEELGQDIAEAKR
ncbi:MAG: hypothetical protein RLZZ293_512 [Pseudomonadota bacterium]|jgi:hypothetical protein